MVINVNTDLCYQDTTVAVNVYGFHIVDPSKSVSITFNALMLLFLIFIIKIIENSRISGIFTIHPVGIQAYNILCFSKHSVQNIIFSHKCSYSRGKILFIPYLLFLCCFLFQCQKYFEINREQIWCFCVKSIHKQSNWEHHMHGPLKITLPPLPSS